MFTDEMQEQLDRLLEAKKESISRLERDTDELALLAGNGETHDFSLEPANVKKNAAAIRELLKPYDPSPGRSLKELADLVRHTHKTCIDQAWVPNAESIAKMIEEWK